ncbi:DNA oxidative demethylase ALKBH2-like [Haliotis rufescens]|uniref:DNA oxidative demethylase ALKBH2-like n=1 Tax=Haliotis rufescens TaxID=6454 RepID=UPI00201EF5A6|nr:DNA oxidative demethylase ALKBH2-like [Haliotis rufescens]
MLCNHMDNSEMSLDSFVKKTKRKIPLDGECVQVSKNKKTKHDPSNVKVESEDSKISPSNATVESEDSIISDGKANDLEQTAVAIHSIDASPRVDEDSQDDVDAQPKLLTVTTKSDLKWRKISGEKLDCDYLRLYSRREADELMSECERVIEYNSGHLARVQIFGKWHDIPRKQVAHGDSGLSYSFSGNTVHARPWLPLLASIRDTISSVTGKEFNFVLINRYKDGCDHIGEHKDDEKDLVRGHPIASLSLGQPRDFVFKHQDARGKNASRKIKPVQIELQHGCLLMMNHPTNSFWYHSLPQRKKLTGVRINMTFRKMVVQDRSKSKKK